jgi:hypothetical protein
MTTSADRFLSYCNTIAQEFNSRLNRIKSFVQHNLSTGTANETILREFLSAHTPDKFAVGEGFICDPFQSKSVSNQCDVLIFDKNNFPLVYSVGSIKVVLPRAARMVIEVKTSFGKKDIHSAISNIESAKKLKSRNLTGVIVAFNSPSLKTVIANIKNYPSSIETEHLPTAILLLDKDLIIHRWGWLRNKEIEEDSNLNPNSFSIRKAKSNKKGFAITFLLSLFFLATELELYEAEVINMLTEMFE